MISGGAFGGDSGGRAPRGCTFCRIAAGELPVDVVLDEPGVLAFLDVRPVFKGHTLVVPRAHRGVLADLDAGELAAVTTAAQRLSVAVELALGAQGSWVSVNNRVSQSVPHVHVHVVPRTKGDGLRGFFWPRTRYADEVESAEYARRLRDAVA